MSICTKWNVFFKLCPSQIIIKVSSKKCLVLLNVICISIPILIELTFMWVRNYQPWHKLYKVIYQGFLQLSWPVFICKLEVSLLLVSIYMYWLWCITCVPFFDICFMVHRSVTCSSNINSRWVYKTVILHSRRHIIYKE